MGERSERSVAELEEKIQELNKVIEQHKNDAVLAGKIGKQLLEENEELRGQKQVFFLFFFGEKRRERERDIVERDCWRGEREEKRKDWKSFCSLQKEKKEEIMRKKEKKN